MGYKGALTALPAERNWAITVGDRLVATALVPTRNETSQRWLTDEQIRLERLAMEEAAALERRAKHLIRPPQRSPKTNRSYRSHRCGGSAE